MTELHPALESGVYDSASLHCPGGRLQHEAHFTDEEMASGGGFRAPGQEGVLVEAPLSLFPPDH